MRVTVISLEPVGGYDRETGARRLAKVDFFLPDLQVTLRDIVLSHDHEDGFAIVPIKSKTGAPAVQIVRGSTFAQSLSKAAAETYSRLQVEDIAELRALYRAA